MIKTQNFSWPLVVVQATMVIVVGGLLAACQKPGWAKDEEITQVKPVAGQLPPLPSSYFPPPPTEEKTEEDEPSQPPPPQPSAVTVTQIAPAAPAPAPTPERGPEIVIPIPPELLD